MTEEEWIERQLAKAPERSDEWVAAMLRRFGIDPVRQSLTACDPAAPPSATTARAALCLIRRGADTGE
ncbi:hypothetical protein [Streptomyces sp. Cmuel-A718b]|uniref:hypothetical protein n=1 Tax=Streptomyces sp. Cmuel-A718b TaxID=697328 RepID=UPI00081E8529|nr:hypothetical protein [Streptomyces sp. Cmuel-A718b]SCF88669.1 hypothetical protein GA0115280_118245 [Streptomyces sp. Cmuel-A718b]